MLNNSYKYCTDGHNLPNYEATYTGLSVALSAPCSSSDVEGARCTGTCINIELFYIYILQTMMYHILHKMSVKLKLLILTVS